LLRTDGGGNGREQFTSEPEGIRTATLSGDGHVAWVVTNRGRLLKFDLSSGAKTEFIGPVPAVLGLSFQPGGNPVPNPVLVDYRGSPGEPLTLTASVAAGERLQVQIGGRTAPIRYLGNGTLTVQAPWELDASTTSTPYQIVIVPDEPSGWTSAASLRLYPALPRFVAAVSQGFEAVIDEGHRARAGDIVHLYGTGFGAVHPRVATGEPAPTEPLARLVDPLTCSVSRDNDAQLPATVLFAGLAPLTVGYYQIDVRLPDNVPSGAALLSCDLPNWCIGACGIRIGIHVQ
jgi:uncharacterized protein (TIGR03437 family)